ncbi:MFS general substrate transporter [Sparassis crispa]|uniref:MFS general substrate transporter n=1 Tax=Sparassis crispa TaxID=139825 RepID=A0A401H2J1_9APHY|nr:MFS general substrate transporter [Sparassis crispa]GBE88612.1 MFS general substrate transporter [Sparassis crispa]
MSLPIAGPPPAHISDDGRSLGDFVSFSDIQSHLQAPGSALDVEELPRGSVDLSAIPPTSERIRRRSELPRTRPSDSPTAFKPEFIELPVLSKTTEEPLYGQSSGVRAPGISSKSEISIGDVETAAGSVPASAGASWHISDEVNLAASTVSAGQKAIYRRNSRIQFAALCYAFFLEGWNDGTTGPLLPTIQRHYGIGFAIVSLLFVFNTVGFLSGAMVNVYLNDRFGLGKVLVIGAFSQLVGYALMAPGSRFPVMCLAFCFSGFGISLQNAQANGFVGSLKEHARIKFGLLHGSYGLGAFVAPLVATHFATSRHWSYHYVISAGIGITNTLVLLAVFRLKKQDDILAEAGQAAGETHPERDNKYRQILGIKEVHFLSIFSLIYVGVEVSLGGWIVTFIEQKRGGNATAGYISSGFFGGLMLGRIFLMWLNRKVGERRIMFFYGIIAIILEVTVWVVPSLIENAVAVSFIGLLLGPMYPILMNHSTAILPKWLLTGCMGYIAGFGQAGSAVLPFVTGLLASKFGIGSLQPLIVSMMSTMIVIWAIVPRVRRFD